MRALAIFTGALCAGGLAFLGDFLGVSLVLIVLIVLMPAYGKSRTNN